MIFFKFNLINNYDLMVKDISHKIILLILEIIKPIAFLMRFYFFIILPLIILPF